MSHYKGAYQRQINPHYVMQYDSLNRYVLRLFLKAVIQGLFTSIAQIIALI